MTYRNYAAAELNSWMLSEGARSIEADQASELVLEGLSKEEAIWEIGKMWLLEEIETAIEDITNGNTGHGSCELMQYLGNFFIKNGLKELKHFAAKCGLNSEGFFRLTHHAWVGPCHFTLDFEQMENNLVSAAEGQDETL